MNKFAFQSLAIITVFTLAFYFSARKISRASNNDIPAIRKVIQINNLSDLEDVKVTFEVLSNGTVYNLWGEKMVSKYFTTYKVLLYQPYALLRVSNDSNSYIESITISLKATHNFLGYYKDIRFNEYLFIPPHQTKFIRIYYPKHFFTK